MEKCNNNLFLYGDHLLEGNTKSNDGYIKKNKFRRK